MATARRVVITGLGVIAPNGVGKDAFVFNMDVISSPIPFNLITFRAKSVDSDFEIVRSTPNVAGKMALNWRMKDAPKGEYDLTIEGHAGAAGTVTSAPIRVKINASRSQPIAQHIP